MRASYATLTGANSPAPKYAAHAANFSYRRRRELYSTASYQARDLSGIGLIFNDLDGWNLAGQNLTNAGFNVHTDGEASTRPI